MKLERAPHGILIGDTFVSIHEALDLLQWLSEQRDALVIADQMAPPKHPEPAYKGSKDEWTAAEIAEMFSEDEQILRMEF